MKGKFEEALVRMEGLGQDTLRTLKHYHYWIASMGLLKLQRCLHGLALLYNTACHKIHLLIIP